MNDAQIEALLPHRRDALLVDRIVETCSRTGSGVIASEFTSLTVSVLRQRLAPMDADEENVDGVVPPLFVLEAFAQACGIVWSLVGADDNPDRRGLILGAARGVTFHTTANADVTLLHRVAIDSDSGSNATFSGEIVTAGEDISVATVESLLAVRSPHDTEPRS
ncbi:hypothetical protein CH253_16870 [Rhodococcus sp. 06-156-3C]|nr:MULTISPECIES: hypothetical protein [unclassified Rhodococcus (in: high G+C Gram-positive bacteria)]OZD18159.1 hypothetical protein CH280_06195 [Rhodococcus sp. 06-156-4C]OZD18756.1 hypothetical protein CH253_16870 [Rhodococcus sp. 06-156-3C]OZD22266.1 hypothetical protein CH248_08455 [Rhodococcus sp. 06-156-4a]OZD38809.1 hypothetical protein CH284_06700 [Rhodococcus sp. 06-156-3]OZD34072.1 hypothetical protein CH247_08280 [Rhodococcus sp. 06-156-3b]